jgi:hypothetical protein
LVAPDPHPLEDGYVGLRAEKRRTFDAPRFMLGRRERYSATLKPPVVEKALRFLDRSLSNEFGKLGSILMCMSLEELAKVFDVDAADIDEMEALAAGVDKWRRFEFARSRFRWGFPPRCEVPVRHEYALLLVFDGRPVDPAEVEMLLEAGVQLVVSFVEHLAPHREEVGLDNVRRELPDRSALDWLDVPRAPVSVGWDTVHVLAYKVADSALLVTRPRGLGMHRFGGFPRDGGLTRQLRRLNAGVQAAQYCRILNPGAGSEDTLQERLKRISMDVRSSLAAVFEYDPELEGEVGRGIWGSTPEFYRMVFENVGDQDFFHFAVCFSPDSESSGEDGSEPLARLQERIRVGAAFPFFEGTLPAELTRFARFCVTCMSAQVTYSGKTQDGSDVPVFALDAHGTGAQGGLTMPELCHEFLDAASYSLGRARP